MATRNGQIRRAAKKVACQAKSASHSFLNESGEQLRHVADNVLSRAEDGLASVQDATAVYVDQGRETIRSLGSLASSYVQKKPVQALAIAVGAGALLALFIRRK